MSKLYRFIVNPKSGSAVNATLIRHVIEALQERGDRVMVHLTKSLEHATELAQIARESNNAEALVVAGGDGTVRSVAQGMAGSTIPLLVIPTGTENLLACELGMDGTPTITLRTLEHGVAQNLDLGRVNGEHHFMAILGVGFDAEVIRRIDMFRKGHITHTDYIWPICRTFWEHQFPHLEVYADGECVCDEPGLLFVSNISRYAIGLKISPEADFGDGELDVTIYKAASRRELLCHAGMTIVNQSQRSGKVVRTRAKRIEVGSRSAHVPIEVDGDLKLALPLEIEVVPAAARVIRSPRLGHPAYYPPRKFYYLRRWLLR